MTSKPERSTAAPPRAPKASLRGGFPGRSRSVVNTLQLRNRIGWRSRASRRASSYIAMSEEGTRRSRPLREIVKSCHSTILAVLSAEDADAVHDLRGIGPQGEVVDRSLKTIGHVRTCRVPQNVPRSSPGRRLRLHRREPLDRIPGLDTRYEHGSAKNPMTCRHRPRRTPRRSRGLPSCSPSRLPSVSAAAAAGASCAERSRQSQAPTVRLRVWRRSCVSPCVPSFPRKPPEARQIARCRSRNRQMIFYVWRPVRLDFVGQAHGELHEVLAVGTQRFSRAPRFPR